MANQWFEKLPQSCPPSDAKVCEGTFYRVSHGNPAESKDFFSQQLLAPEKKFKGEGIDDCIVRAVSIFSSLDDAEQLLKLPKFKGANIAEIHFYPEDGKLKKTFKKSHYSWWRSKAFHVKKTKIVDL